MWNKHRSLTSALSYVRSVRCVLYSYGHVLQDIMPEMQKYWPDLLAPFSPEFWYVIIKVEYIHVTLNDAGDGKLVFLFV